MSARRAGPYRPAHSAASSPPDPRSGRRRACLSRFLPALALLLGALSLFEAAPAQAQFAPPTGLTVTASSQQLDISWTAPATGTVTGYDVHYTSSTTVGDDDPAQGGGSASGWWDPGHSGTGTTHTVSGLSNGTTYRMRVRAVYAGGSSAWVHRSGMPTAPPPPSLTVAPEPDGPIWSARLTVDKDDAYFGCDDDEATHDNCSTALSDNDFTYKGVTYVVEGLFNDQGVQNGQVNSFLTIEFDPSAPGGTFILNLGGTMLSTSDADAEIHKFEWNFSDTGLTWEDDQQVSVSLSAQLTRDPPEPISSGGNILDHDALLDERTDRERFLDPRPRPEVCDLLVGVYHPSCLPPPMNDKGPVQGQRAEDPSLLRRAETERQDPPPAQYANLIGQMNDWRNDPNWVHAKPHTDRWDRALLTFGEPVSDTSLTPMTAAEAQGYADRGWTRWVGVADALNTVVTGTGGADTLTGSGSGELLVGLGGADTLSGHGGNDELRGGSGNDRLTGGAGADRFVFFTSQTGANAITDFAAGDVIVLKGSGWPSVADIIAGVQAVGSTNYRYTLASGLTVETTNNRPLRTEDFATE